MRTARIKASTATGDAIYHCMTRTVNGAFLLDDPAKEVLRKQLWQIAAYCGIRVLTYAIMSNHFHVLVRVHKAGGLSDAELLRRYALLYPKPTRFQQQRIEVIQHWLSTGDPEGEAWRKRQLALMGDVSQFMKLLKQRFSVWFNRTHSRYGTLWAERFKSVLVGRRIRDGLKMLERTSKSRLLSCAVRIHFSPPLQSASSHAHCPDQSLHRHRRRHLPLHDSHGERGFPSR